MSPEENDLFRLWLRRRLKALLAAHGRVLIELPPAQEARFQELHDRLAQWNDAGAKGPDPTKEMAVSKEEFSEFRGWQELQMTIDHVASKLPPDAEDLQAIPDDDLAFISKSAHSPQ